MAVIIATIATVLLAFYGVLYSLLAYNMRFHDWIAEYMTDKANVRNMKEERELQGRRFYVPWKNKRDVRVNLYEYEQEKPVPMLFVAHDSSFTDGDADDIDELCAALRDELHVTVISINYSKLAVHVSTYPQDEIQDTVLYFVLHAGEFHLDPDRYVLAGAGAGGYLTMIAGVAMTQKSLFPNGFILINPYLDYVALSFAQVEIHPGPLALVFTGEPDAKQEEYEYDLDHTDLVINIRRYRNAPRDFLRIPDCDERRHFIHWIRDELDYFYSRERTGK